MARTPKEKKAVPEERLEKMLWDAADKLSKNNDVAEYKHHVLGLIFLERISGTFEESHTKLLEGQGDYAGVDHKNEYIAENVFNVPPTARLSFLLGRVRLLGIGKFIDKVIVALKHGNLLPMLQSGKLRLAT